MDSIVSRKKITLRWISRAISFFALFFLVLLIYHQYQKIELTFKFSNIYFLFFSFLFSMLFFLLRAQGYRSLLNQKSPKFQFWIVARYVSASEFVRYIPGNIWGFAARIIKAPLFGIQKDVALYVMIEEIIMLGLTAAIICGLGLLVAPLENYIWKIAGITLLVSPVVLLYFPSILRLLLPLIAKFSKLAQTAQLIQTKNIIKSSAWYLAMWASYGLIHFFIFKTFFTSSSSMLLLVMTVSVASWLVGYASFLTPSGLGIREVVFTFMLSPFTTQPQAATIALLSRMYMVITELFFYGVTFVFTSKKSEPRITPKSS